MKKSLSQRIAEDSSRKKPRSRAQNLAAFLALRDEVKNAIDDGWPLLTIWEQLSEEKKISNSYKSFRGYVKRLLVVSTTSKRRFGTGKNTTAASNTPGGFKYNPNPKKEELI